PRSRSLAPAPTRRSSELPPTSIDPELFETEEGALALYRGTLRAFRRGFGGANGSFVLVTGRMTDELTTGAYTASGAPLTLSPNTDRKSTRLNSSHAKNSY